MEVCSLLFQLKMSFILEIPADTLCTSAVIRLMLCIRTCSGGSGQWVELVSGGVVSGRSGQWVELVNELAQAPPLALPLLLPSFEMLPLSPLAWSPSVLLCAHLPVSDDTPDHTANRAHLCFDQHNAYSSAHIPSLSLAREIGRASCRERV